MSKPSLILHAPRRDGQYRVNCGTCGQTTESQNVFDPNGGGTEAHIFAFLNLHSGMGHSGVYEAWYRGRWVVGAPWSPLTDEDVRIMQSLGGL